MKYLNAAEILPKELLDAIKQYAEGEMLYIPTEGKPKKWGETSGSRIYYEIRNRDIKNRYKEGKSISEIAKEQGLAFDTVRKIIYS